jgi:hypothetical protein
MRIPSRAPRYRSPSPIATCTSPTVQTVGLTADVERAGVRDRGRRRSRVAISGIEQEHNCAFWDRVALKP